MWNTNLSFTSQRIKVLLDLLVAFKKACIVCCHKDNNDCENHKAEGPEMAGKGKADCAMGSNFTVVQFSLFIPHLIRAGNGREILLLMQYTDAIALDHQHPDLAILQQEPAQPVALLH